MSRFNNKQLIAGIQNGNNEVIVYLAEKYFPYTRKMLRTKGVRDSMTPEFFSSVLVKVCLDIVQNKFPSSIEFETFFFNCMKDSILEWKSRQGDDTLGEEVSLSDQQKLIVAQCVSILDEQSKKLVHAYYAERLSFETIATKFNFSNPVIAQYEVNKAINQLEGIVTLRLMSSLN